MKASKKKWTRPAYPRPVLTRGEMEGMGAALILAPLAHKAGLLLCRRQ